MQYQDTQVYCSLMELERPKLFLLRFYLEQNLTGVRGMKEAELAYCGLDCEKCPAFIATANDDDSLRQKTAQEWSSLYAKILARVRIAEDLRPEDIICRGAALRLFICRMYEMPDKRMQPRKEIQNMCQLQ